MSLPQVYEPTPSTGGVIAVSIGPAAILVALALAFSRPAPPPAPPAPPPPTPLAAMAHAPAAELVFVVESDLAIERVIVDGAKRIDVQGNRATLTLASFAGARDAEVALEGGRRTRVTLVADGPRAIFAPVASASAPAPSLSSPVIRRSFGLRGPLLRGAPEP